ncbi:MAG: JAB domain-containing protein [Nitrospinaceae bacterium]|nr:JAB domain-containing protein [Nitrospinaceae bacterium]MBT4093888.1 JAB domain-containing protein [Nitrospinaceae bacterium]MBT5367033.1 JAB domain-containing protein [Nitrospinaceae bacterium]MBT6393651.1 JAB domain-containing protein [Nitrospinaceae bacterium]
MLDTKHRLKRDIMVARRTLLSTSVDPREVFNAAVREKSTAIVCSHNHPSGDPLPSPEDNALTTKLRETGKFWEFPFLTTLSLVGRDSIVTMRKCEHLEL